MCMFVWGWFVVFFCIIPLFIVCKYCSAFVFVYREFVYIQNTQFEFM